MLEILIVIAFCWLSFKVIGLALRMAWCTAKVIASLLVVVAVPVLIVCLIFAGGLFLLVPIILAGIAFALLKACI